MSIFDKRVNYKPYEYPEVLKFVDAINRSYWLHTEFNYASDIQDFHTKLNDKERNAIKNALFAISQVEINVKSFWGDLYKHLPKPEFNDVGSTFAENETRHSRSYAHLLEIMGFNDEFTLALQNESIQGRIEYLAKYLRNASSDNKRLYTLTLTLFSLFIENCSLFSQFLIVKSFNKERNLFKGIDNVIMASAKEEQLHAMLGAYLINTIRSEFPEWFDDDFINTVNKACFKALKSEIGILDWVFEKGELDFLSKQVVIEYLKNRFNISMEMCGFERPFIINRDILSHTEWFEIETLTETHTDFFHKTPIAYNKKAISITEDDIF